MPSLGPMELLIILAVVVIIFGVGRLPEVGGALGKSIREFRKTVKEDDEEKPQVQSRAADARPEAGGQPSGKPSSETRRH
ncbi:MAG TPA: twin-arginine translocase TatA/TatE family subunit [Dehalococcoidia bacterium]